MIFRLSECSIPKTTACLFGVVIIVVICFQWQGFLPERAVFVARFYPFSDKSSSKKDNKGTKSFDVIYDQYTLAREIKNIHDLHYNIPPAGKCVKRRPQCIIIGVAKCGTTELVDFMALHPNIVIKGQSETYFNPVKSQSVHKLIQSMPCSFHDQVTVFKNSGFFSNMNPESLYKYNKTLKMIVLVREPVSRLVSSIQFRYFNYSIKSNLNVKENISAMPSIDHKLIDPNTGDVYTSRRPMSSAYDVSLKRYLKYFTLENLLIIETKEFINNPAQVLYKVETFLGLKHLIDKQSFVYNKEKGFYCIKSLKEQMVCYGSNRGRSEFKEIRNETRAKLRDFYRPHNENFFKIIGERYDW